MNTYLSVIKPILDRLLALLAIIGSAPFLLAISIYVYCFISRGIIFAQMRPGFEQRLFRLYKFKTMTDECDADGSLLPDDERLSKYGQFLRKTSLDELPEFFNIVMGEMSFVGPRPLLVEYLPLYSKEHLRRHEVKPGLTGLAQVNGRNQLEWEEKLFLDIKYVEQVSIWLDIKIIFQTVFQVLKSKDIDHHGEIMAKFEGSKDK